MNAQKMKNLTAVTGKLAYLSKDYMPDAVWTIEGIFRHDYSVYQLVHYLTHAIPLGRFSRLTGAVPCLWSLDWFEQRRPIDLPHFAGLLNNHLKLNLGLTLIFDNPFIKEEDLDNHYALSLVTELCRNNPHKKNAVSVANDMLAEHLRSQYPDLELHCHVNKIGAEPETVTRSADYYNKLLTRYQRVCLHPDDAFNPNIYTAISDMARVDIIVNDTCLRGCPLRKKHLELLDDKRRHPYVADHRQRRLELQSSAGCLNAFSHAPHEKTGNTLTKKECRALYDAGYRSFIIQSHRFRNEMTLMWDIFQCMFAPTPAISNKLALLISSTLGNLRPAKNIPASGLKSFSSLNYD